MHSCAQNIPPVDERVWEAGNPQIQILECVDILPDLQRLDVAYDLYLITIRPY